MKGLVYMADWLETYSPGSYGNCQGSCSVVNIKCPSYNHVSNICFPGRGTVLWGCREVGPVVERQVFRGHL